MWLTTKSTTIYTSQCTWEHLCCEMYHWLVMELTYGRHICNISEVNEKTKIYTYILYVPPIQPNDLIYTVPIIYGGALWRASVRTNSYKYSYLKKTTKILDKGKLDHCASLFIKLKIITWPSSWRLWLVAKVKQSRDLVGFD